MAYLTSGKKKLLGSNTEGKDIDFWQPNTDYKVGDIVLKDNIKRQCIVEHTSADFDVEKDNWIYVFEQYYHVTQEQYNKMVSDGLITVGTKDLYIIYGNSEENTITNPAVGKSYSTDEQLTGGTWIDGKPIYRKTVSCGQLPNKDGKDTPHGIDNIDKVICTYGIAIDSSSINISLPFADASSDGSISAYRNGTVIRITTAKDRTSFTESYVTLEYTKTTD